jgi:hypothetical protein
MPAPEDSTRPPRRGDGRRARFHTVRYVGVLASASRLRPRILPLRAPTLSRSTTRRRRARGQNGRHREGALYRRPDEREAVRQVGRQRPFKFTLGQGNVIKGWDEGVPGMKVGGKRKLTIPWRMAYGEAGSGDKIPPKAALKFDVELLEIVKAEAGNDTK